MGIYARANCILWMKKSRSKLLTGVIPTSVSSSSSGKACSPEINSSWPKILSWKMLRRARTSTFYSSWFWQSRPSRTPRKMADWRLPWTKHRRLPRQLTKSSLTEVMKAKSWSTLLGTTMGSPNSRSRFQRRRNWWLSKPRPRSYLSKARSPQLQSWKKKRARYHRLSRASRWKCSRAILRLNWLWTERSTSSMLQQTSSWRSNATYETSSTSSRSSRSRGLRSKLWHSTQ